MFCPSPTTCAAPKASLAPAICQQRSFTVPTSSPFRCGGGPKGSEHPVEDSNKEANADRSHSDLRGCSDRPVVTWMQSEVLPRLQRLDERLDNLDRLATRWTITGGNTCHSLSGSARPRSKDTDSPRQHSKESESAWQRRVVATRRDSFDASWTTGGYWPDSGRGDDSIPLPREVPCTASASASTACTTIPSGPSFPTRKGTNTLLAEHCRVDEESRMGSRCESRCESRSSAQSVLRTSAKIKGKLPGMFRMFYERRKSSLHTLTTNKKIHMTKVKVWNFLDNPDGPDAGPFSHGYHFCISMFTMLSVGAALLQSQDASITNISPDVMNLLQVVIEATFAAEFVLRLACCPNHLMYFLVWHNVIDVLAIAPLALRAVMNFQVPEGVGRYPEDLERNLLLAVVPVLRFLKLIRRFERFRLMLAAVELYAEALPVCIFSLVLLTLIFSASIFLIEPRDNIATLPQAMWLTIVTMTTVGYGDITPVSPEGSTVAGVMVVTSVLYMAMPLGIIGQAFTEVWDNRDMLLLRGKTKDLLRQWSYKAKDIPLLFKHFNQSGSPSLTQDEFVEMIKQMRIGLSHARAAELFECFDLDDDGTLEASEFVKALFPTQFKDIYPMMIQAKSPRGSSVRGDRPPSSRSVKSFRSGC